MNDLEALRYIASYPDLVRAYGANPEAGRRHWWEFGRVEGRNPLLFDPLIYGASHPDLIRAYGNNPGALLAHYFEFGFREGRATDSFEPLHYAASNTDLARAYGNNPGQLLAHYYEFGFREGRATASFDALRYAASNPQLIAAYGFNEDGLIGHYVATGVHQGLQATSFDPLLYAASNPDVIRFYGLNPTAFTRHYVGFGHGEGRAVASFDPVQYVAANADLVRAGLFYNQHGALIHFLELGVWQGRPTSGFDAVAYLLSNPDLGNAGLGSGLALRHWLDSGAAEGRVGDALFGREQPDHAMAGGTVSSTIDSAGDRDWFQLSLSGGTPITFEAIGLAAPGTPFPADLAIHDQSGRLVASRPYGSSNQPAVLNFTPASTGLYYVVIGSSQTGQYQLTAREGSDTMTIGGRNYSDADFAGLSGVRVLIIEDTFTTVLGPNAQAAGIRVVRPVSNLASTTDASAYTVGLTVDVSAGGGDTVRTGSGDDQVVLGSGAQVITLNGGNDLVTGTYSGQAIDGGAGTDTLVLGGTLTLDLARLTGVERLQQAQDTILNLIITASSPPAPTAYEIVGSNAILNLSLDPGLSTPGLSFTIRASDAGTYFHKYNVGVPTGIDFIGGAGDDRMIFNANDITPGVQLDGGGGADRLTLNGGVMTDSRFATVDSVETVGSVAGALDATLDSNALAAGIRNVEMVRGSNHLVVGPGFTATLAASLTGPRNFFDSRTNTTTNLIDASASAGALRLTADSSELQADDIVRGSTRTDDALIVNYLVYVRPTVGSDTLTPINLSGVTGIETIRIDIVDLAGLRKQGHGPVIVDTQLADLNGTDTQTIQVVGAIPYALYPDVFAPIDATLAGARLVISGSPNVRGGSGNDTITAPSFASILDGSGGDDTITGSNAADQIDGGPGNDVLIGLDGADSFILDAGEDRLVYTSMTHSRTGAVDSVADFVSGSDVIDVRGLQGFAGKTIDFVGNGNDTASAQALLTPNDSTLDAVFQRDTATLWFDNGDGVLDQHDLRIVLTGVISLTGSDVLDGTVVAP